MSKLQLPFNSEKLQLKNRWAMAPMTRSFSPLGLPSDQVEEYYVNRAKGGVGLIITEGIPISHASASGYPDVATIHNPNSHQRWKSIIERVHKEGAKIIPQLWHVGSLRKVGFDPNNEIPCLAPSEVAHPRYAYDNVTSVKPMALSHLDIREIIQSYASTAKTAKDLGFDGIEIHGAHGYLIDQFLWPVTNKRTDEYGGDLKSRMRFALEVISEIRKAVGAEFCLIFRFSQWKLGDYDYQLFSTPEELQTFLESLAQAGVDIFHPSTRRFWDESFEGKPLSYWTKKLTSKPVITVGSIGLDVDFTQMLNISDIKATNIELLENYFSQNYFDIAAVGRSLISDAEWVNKIEANDLSSIKSFSVEDISKL